MTERETVEFGSETWAYDIVGVPHSPGDLVTMTMPQMDSVEFCRDAAFDALEWAAGLVGAECLTGGVCGDPEHIYCVSCRLADDFRAKAREIRMG